MELLEDTMNGHTEKISLNVKWKHAPTLVDLSRPLILMSGLSTKKKFANNAGRNFKIFNASTYTGMIRIRKDGLGKGFKRNNIF